uniref:Autophagy-related protein 9 n=1 Tax=Rhabditophanes sp. KR3021 TaxID=114890 RepID=A0AC35UGU6_9BILA
MVNRKVLPFRLALPFEIELPYLSTTLRENIYWILFTGPYAPWNGPYTIKPTVKNASTIEAMALELENTIYYVAILNVVCLPFTFVYQVLYTFFNYGHTIRSSASTLSSRTYSNLAKTELRHFNELEHELHIRLNKSYKFGIEYVNQFKSTLLDVVAKTIAFIFGSVFIIIVVLSSIDEDVLSRVEYVVTIMSVSGVIAFVSGSLVHDENTFWNPNHSMTTLVGFLHYLPEYFVGDAHTMRVRKEFNAMFQFKAQYIFEEFLSPFVTPYVLWYVIKPQSKEIIQFLNKYTVTKEGLGDICTFSQMSVDQHGDPELIDSVSEHSGDVPLTFEIDNIKKAYQVKTELSLLNFVANNPYWEPTASGKAFLEKFNKAKFNDGFVLQTMSKSQVLRKENSEDIEELPGMSDIGGVNQQSTLITSQSGMNELGGSNTVRSTSLPFDIPVQPNARAGDANSSLNMSINAIYVNKLRAQQNNINASIFNSVMRSQNRGGGTGGSVNASGIVGQHGVNPWAVPYESFFMGGSTSSINNSQTRPPTQNETERGSRMPGIVEHQESGDERGSPQTKHN